MLTVKTRVRVVDGRLEADLPTPVPPGDHEAVIVTTQAKRLSRSVST